MRQTKPKPVAFDWAGFEPFPSHFLGVSAFDTSDTKTIRTYIDWNALFRQWELPIPFPKVLDDAEWGEVAHRLLHEANALIDGWVAEGQLDVEVTFGVWRASAQGDEVVVQPGNQSPVSLLFPRLSLSDKRTYCLTDFIKPMAELNAGESDYIGGYAIRLSESILTSIRQWKAENDEYRAYLATDLCTLYVSAVADYFHYRLRRFIWAYCDDDDLSNEDVIEGLHQGIRVVIGSSECPDPTEADKLFSLLAISNPVPDAFSQCGYCFAHPRSRLLAELDPEN
jgi:5-methyltetrahydrofolate--homocysteine methyltransferase